MIASRVNTLSVLAFCAALALPALAQDNAVAPVQASPKADPVLPIEPVTPATAAPAPAVSTPSRDASFLPVTAAPVTPATPVIQAPALAVPVATPVATTIPPTLSAPAVASPPSIVAPPTAAPSTSVPVPAGTSTPATPEPPPSIAKPVEAEAIGSIDSESIGLIGKNGGGLGADIWKGTSRALAAKLTQSLNLPTSSATLNGLARRLLITAAAAPEGASENKQSFVGNRIDKLLALGAVTDAWKLAAQAKSELIDDSTLRAVSEAALLGSESDNVCTKLPEIVKTHSDVEWQKLMLVCQLRAKDTKAAQLTLDVMHTQGMRDDIFYYIAEKNIIGNNTQLPRQLTPLKPLTLALVRLTDIALPGEIYTHPDAALIPELLAAKARVDVARLGLAERATERGLITATDLGKIYSSISFAPETLAGVNATAESGPRLRALLYQAALADKSLQNRADFALRYVQSANAGLINGGGAIVADMLGDAKPADEFNTISGTVAHLYVLANSKDAAAAWIKQAHHAAIGMPAVTAELQSFWPLAVLEGLESESDFTANGTKWLDDFLKNTATPKDAAQRPDQAAALLLLLDAAGFAVANDDWAKVMGDATDAKRVMPSALMLERMRATSTSPKRGETLLYALNLAGNGTGKDTDVPLLSAVEIVRALRMSGFGDEARAFARETAQIILNPAKP